MRTRRNGRGAPADYAAAGELKLYIDNERSVYEAGRMYRAALEKRMQKGTFNLALAAKGFGWIVEEGAKKYAKEFGGTWHSMFSPATREVVAKEMAQEWYEEYRIQHPTKNSRRKRVSRRNSGKLIRFPEGVMTEAEWVARYADRVSPLTVTWTWFYNRSKFNRLEGDSQDEYIASLKKKAEKPLYFAYKGDVNYQISKSTYDAAPARLKAPKANRRKRTSRRNGRWKVWTGPTAVRQVAEAYSAFPGVTDVLAGTEHVHFTYDGDLNDLTKRGVPALVRAYAIGLDRGYGAPHSIKSVRNKRTSRRARRTSRRRAA